MSQVFAKRSQDVRRVNRAAVLRYLRAHPGASRVTMAQALDLSKALVTQITSDLIAEGWVRERQRSAASADQRRAGRPQIGIELVDTARTGLGLLLVPFGAKGELRIEAAWAGFGGAVSHLAAVTGRPRNNRELVDLVRRAFDQAVDSTPALSRICTVTLGVPGVIDEQEIVLAPRLGFTVGTSLLPDLELHLGVKVQGENDAALGAIGELHHRPDRPPFAFLLISAGVGAAIYRDGAVLGSRRALPRLGEVGHVSVACDGGELRELESFLGVPGDVIGGESDLAWLEAGLKADDPQAAETVEKYAVPLVTTLQIFGAWGCREVILQFPSDPLREAILHAAMARMSGSRLAISVGRPFFGKACLVTGAALDAVGDAGEVA